MPESPRTPRPGAQPEVGFAFRLTEFTQMVMTVSLRRRLRRKEKHRQRHPVVDWADAIISAVVIVLVINQFLFQAYQIPSQSMVPTLEISDRIFVNKLIYGPELVPGQLKLLGLRQPRRGEVIIFENPSYVGMGPAMDILQRVIYMVTLSLVDIDRDDQGLPKHHFLIKRAIGVAGDRLRMRRGEVEILLPGSDRWLPEEQIKTAFELSYPRQRLVVPDAYAPLRAATVARTLTEMGLPTVREPALSGGQDYLFAEKWRARTVYAAQPYNRNAALQWRVLENGWYIPPGNLLPMGDNRDDSRDGRVFGPVSLGKVLGKGMFHYWPPARWGAIH